MLHVQILVPVKVSFIRAAVRAVLAEKTPAVSVVLEVLDEVRLLGRTEGTQSTFEGPDVDVRHDVPLEVAPVLGLVVAVPAHVGFLVRGVVHHVEDEGVEGGRGDHALFAEQAVVRADNCRLGGALLFVFLLFVNFAALVGGGWVCVRVCGGSVHLEERFEHCGGSWTLHTFVGCLAMLYCLLSADTVVYGTGLFVFFVHDSCYEILGNLDFVWLLHWNVHVHIMLIHNPERNSLIMLNLYVYIIDLDISVKSL